MNTSAPAVQPTHHPWFPPSFNPYRGVVHARCMEVFVPGSGPKPRRAYAQIDVIDYLSDRIAKGHCRSVCASATQACDDLGCSRATFFAAIATMEAAGMLRVVRSYYYTADGRRRNRCNEYRFRGLAREARGGGSSSNDPTVINGLCRRRPPGGDRRRRGKGSPARGVPASAARRIEGAELWTDACERSEKTIGRGPILWRNELFRGDFSIPAGNIARGDYEVEPNGNVFARGMRVGILAEACGTPEERRPLAVRIRERVGRRIVLAHDAPLSALRACAESEGAVQVCSGSILAPWGNNAVVIGWADE